MRPWDEIQQTKTTERRLNHTAPAIIDHFIQSEDWQESQFVKENSEIKALLLFIQADKEMERYEFEEAISSFEAAIALSKKSAIESIDYAMLAYCYWELTGTEDDKADEHNRRHAIKYFRKAIDHSSNSDYPLAPGPMLYVVFNLAGMLSSLGEYKEAAQVFITVSLEQVEAKFINPLKEQLVDAPQGLCNALKTLTNEEDLETIEDLIQQLKDLENRITSELEQQPPRIEEPDTLESLRAKLEVALKRAETAEAKTQAAIEAKEEAEQRAELAKQQRNEKEAESERLHRQIAEIIESNQPIPEGVFDFDTITPIDIRDKGKSIFDRLTNGDWFIISRRGTPRAFLIPYNEYFSDCPKISIREFQKARGSYIDRTDEEEYFVLTRESKVIGVLGPAPIFSPKELSPEQLQKQILTDPLSLKELEMLISSKK